MTKKKVVMVPFVRDRFEQAKRRKGLSTQAIGNMLSKMGEKANKRLGSDKTIRRALKAGESAVGASSAINSTILDNIARILDVSSSYLSGEYDWPLEQLADDECDRYKAVFLDPAKHPYRSGLSQSVDYDSFLEELLMLYSVDSKELEKMSFSQRVALEDALKHNIERVLRHAFSDSRIPDVYYRYGWRDYDIQDIREALFPEQYEPSVGCPFDTNDEENDPFAEKYNHLPIAGENNDG